MNSPYGLYAWEQNDGCNNQYQPHRPTNEKLAYLIYSAYGYPPALAIARSRIGKYFKNDKPEIDQFEERYTLILESLLSEIANAGYFMAAAQEEEIGYLRSGEWYWLLGIDHCEPANAYWVSDDYFIYKNPITDFILSAQQIQTLKQNTPSS